MPRTNVVHQDGPGNIIHAADVDNVDQYLAALSKGVYTAAEYGAKGDGATDDTAALQAAIDAAQAASGYGLVLLAPGATYCHGAPLTMNANPIAFVGGGQSSVLKATAAMTAQIVATDTAFSRFVDFCLDGNGQACDGLRLVTSTGQDKTTTNRVIRVTTQNHAAANWPLYNQGHEDCVWEGCLTRETANGVSCHVPGGANVFTGCSIFGAWDLAYQLISITGCVTGPFLQNPPNDHTLLAVEGSYCYDSATDNLITGVGGNPGAVTLRDCYLALQQAIINSGWSGDTVIKVEDCVLAYTGPAGTYNIVDLGGDHNRIELLNLQYNAGSATASNVASIAGGTTPYVVVRPAVVGATAPTNIVTPNSPAVAASGTAVANPWPGAVDVAVSGGTVSAIAIDGQATGLTSGMFRLLAGHTITLTYSVAPSWVWLQAE